MALLGTLLPGIQVVVSILLIGAILLQQRSAGIGGAFGDNAGENFYTRRGGELWLFRATIVLGVILALSALLALAL